MEPSCVVREEQGVISVCVEQKAPDNDCGVKFEFNLTITTESGSAGTLLLLTSTSHCCKLYIQVKCNIGIAQKMNGDKIGTQTCYVHEHNPVVTLMYIACLCPNLVSVHSYAIPILHFQFPKFLFTCLLLFFLLL